MLTLRQHAEICNDDDILPAHGCTAGLDDSTLTPTDTGSSEPQEQEDFDVPSPSGEMHMDAILTESRARVMAQAAGAEDVWVARESCRRNWGTHREWRVTIFYGPGETYAASADNLASAEFMALAEASIAVVNAAKAERQGKAVAREVAL